jgi:hypothetical protein
VEAIGRTSNLGHLCKKWADLRKRIEESAPRPPQPPKTGRTRALKRQVGREEIDQIIAKYQSGVSTNQLMTEHHLAKRTISALLKANGVQLRRQGLTDKQAMEAADLYQAGYSLARIAHHFDDISPTTVLRVLRKRGILIRSRSG